MRDQRAKHLRIRIRRPRPLQERLAVEKGRKSACADQPPQLLLRLDIEEIQHLFRVRREQGGHVQQHPGDFRPGCRQGSSSKSRSEVAVPPFQRGVPLRVFQSQSDQAQGVWVFLAPRQDAQHAVRGQALAVPMVQDSDDKALPEGGRSRLEQREKVLDCRESFPFIARRKGLAELFEVRLE